MATTFKQLAGADRKVIKTRLHEMIPITGSLISGTYGGNAIALANELHIKKYSHGKFESVFDYPHLSSSANHLFDIAVGAWRNGDFATGSSGGYVEGTMQILTGSDNKYIYKGQVKGGNPYGYGKLEISTQNSKIFSCTVRIQFGSLSRYCPRSKPITVIFFNNK